MNREFIVHLEDGEGLAVLMDNYIQGVIIRPTIEKILQLCSFNEQEKKERIIKESIYLDSDIIIGINGKYNNIRITETTFNLSYSTLIEGEDIAEMQFELFNLQIVKIII